MIPSTRFGLKVSDSYRLAIICLPSMPYFSKAVQVKIEQTFVRAVRGGTGYAKCGGNYDRNRRGQVSVDDSWGGGRSWMTSDMAASRICSGGIVTSM